MGAKKGGKKLKVDQSQYLGNAFFFSFSPIENVALFRRSLCCRDGYARRHSLCRPPLHLVFLGPARRMTIGSHMRRTRGGQTMTATTHGTQITTAGVNIGMAGLFSIDMLFPL